MKRTYICIGGRCSSWGKSWKRHFRDKSDDTCYRCGTYMKPIKNKE